jgi:hypothetical protein
LQPTKGTDGIGKESQIREALVLESQAGLVDGLLQGRNRGLEAGLGLVGAGRLSVVTDAADGQSPGDRESSSKLGRHGT